MLHISTFSCFYVPNLTIWLGYPSSYSSTGSILLTSLSRSCLNSLVTNTTSISRSVILAPSSLALSLKILSISKSLIRGVLCPNLIYWLLFLIPPVRSLVSKYLAYRSKLVVVIFLFSKIMPSCSRCTEKGLVYVAITAPFSQQPSSCSKCTKSNIYLSCNIYFISNAKCIYLAVRLYTF
jgi:hypothetical protein